MESNQQKHNQENDYQFSENEVPFLNDNGYVKTEQVNKLNFKKFNFNKIMEILKNNPKIVKIILLIIGMLLTFKFFVYLSSKSRSSALQELTQVHDGELLSDTSKQNNVEDKVNPMQNFNIPLLKPEKNSVVKYADEEGLNKLSKKLEFVQQDVSKVASFVMEMEDQIDLLKEEIKVLQSKIDNVLTKPNKQKVTDKPVIKRDTYTVRVIVSGRAWLVSSKGNSIDVKVGDILPGYGEIKLISVKKGLVLTSDGSIIKKGRYDS